MSFFFTKHKNQDVENRRKLKIFQTTAPHRFHPFNIFTFQKMVKAKQHITQGDTHRNSKENKQCLKKQKKTMQNNRDITI